MKKIVEVNAKYVNFGSEIMVQLTVMDGNKCEYIIVHDLGEFKAFGVCDYDFMKHYIEDQADDFKPQFKFLYEDEDEALNSEYSKFFKFADDINIQITDANE